MAATLTAKPEAPVRAAEYVRMSTEHQRYSPEHQRAIIGAYAVERGYEIVKSYADDGISGVRLEGRAGLKRLLADVLSGSAEFEKVLVYDVSRWGRFQDPDESAHYEFICKQAGIAIEYCAELFANDGSLSSTLLKHLKRAMAAEYSRELSAKVSHAQMRFAQDGFWQGGPPGYALRRQQVLADGSLGAVLQAGQGKMRESRVILVAGPADEAETVRRIFRLFVAGGMSRRTVARTLNSDAVPAEAGARWTPARVQQVLTNEKYLGIQTFGKTTYFLGRRQGVRPRSAWVRTKAHFEPLVARATFDDAQRNIAKRFRRAGNEQMLEGLRTLLKAHGRITSTLIRDAERLPCPEVYRRRFGGLLRAYELVGYTPGGRAVGASKAARRGKPCGRRDRVPNKLTPEEMIESLRAIYEREGRLSAQIIDDAPGAPSTDKLLKTFGSLLRVYERVGYTPDKKQVITGCLRTARRGAARPGSSAACDTRSPPVSAS